MNDYQVKALLVLLAIQFIACLGVALSKNPTKAKPWMIISLLTSALIFGVTLL